MSVLSSFVGETLKSSNEPTVEAPLSFIDTHTHLYSEEFDPDRAAVVERALQAGAKKLFLPNCNEMSVTPMIQMCRNYPGVCYPMLGLHPTEMSSDPDAELDRLEHLLQQSVDGIDVSSPHFIGIGEVGIDLYWDCSRREEQIRVFSRQVEWALRYNLPLMIHARSVQKEVVEVLRPYRATSLKGVFHCFTGTADEAAELLDFPGFCLGIGGVLTFKKSALPESLHAAVPLDRIVLETDAPYMAPVPHRGKRNESAFLPAVILKLAEIYGVSEENVCRCTTQTALHLFPLAE